MDNSTDNLKSIRQAEIMADEGRKRADLERNRRSLVEGGLTSKTIDDRIRESQWLSDQCQSVIEANARSNWPKK